jgi:hypothetical protein
MLQIRLLGQCDVRLDGKRVLIPSRAGQSLFAYLALTSGTAHRREKLAGTFWPDTSDDLARKHCARNSGVSAKPSPHTNPPRRSICSPTSSRWPLTI